MGETKVGKDLWGACKFCGQQRMITSKNDMTPEQLEYVVTLECECDEAMAFKAIESKKNYAASNIKVLFSKDGMTVMNLLLDHVDALARQTIKKVTIVTADGVRGTLTAKESTIKVDRTETIKESMED